MTLSWYETQSIIAGVYNTAAALSVQLDIGIDAEGGPGSVDASVILIDHDRERRCRPDFQSLVETNNTVVVDLAAFASAYYPWNYIFYVNSEVGLELYQAYLQLAEGRQSLMQKQLIPVPGGLSMCIARNIPQPPPRTPGHSTVCLGGTFDHLHPGHKLLLTAGAILLEVPEKGSGRSCQFIIGITGDEMLKNKRYADYVQPWEVRARGVITFLSTMLCLPRKGWEESLGPEILEEGGDLLASFRDGTISVRCVKFQDIFGPTITTKDIDALVVSGETRSGGQAVNERRMELGWHELAVFEVDVLDAREVSDEVSRTDNFASKISSTSIRQKRAEAKMGAKPG
jgi:phosphopantetheine adenylyltransferase